MFGVILSYRVKVSWATGCLEASSCSHLWHRFRLDSHQQEHTELQTFLTSARSTFKSNDARGADTFRSFENAISLRNTRNAISLRPPTLSTA